MPLVKPTVAAATNKIDVTMTQKPESAQAQAAEADEGADEVEESPEKAHKVVTGASPSF